MILPKLHSQEIVKSRGLEVEPVKAGPASSPYCLQIEQGWEGGGNERGSGGGVGGRMKEEQEERSRRHICTHAQGRLWHMCPSRLCTRYPLPSPLLHHFLLPSELHPSLDPPGSIEKGGDM